VDVSSHRCFFSCPFTPASFKTFEWSHSTQLESIMTKAQLKEIRQILAHEYRMAIACKRTFSPVWYLFV